MHVAECKNCKKYCHKGIGGIGNTFCQSIVIGIDNSFTSIVNIPGSG